MARYNPHANAGGAPSSWTYSDQQATPIASMGGFSFGDLLGKVAGFPVGGAANLAQDIGAASLGFFPGLYKAAVDPIESAKAIGKSYQYNYGDLFGAWSKFTKGDFGGAAGELGDFGEKMYEHPLSYILDAATIATVGAGAAVKVPATLAKVGVKGAPGGTLERLAKAGEREQLKRVDRPGARGRLEALEVNRKTGDPLDPTSRKAVAREDQYFWTSSNPFTKARQKWMHNLSEKWATGDGRFGTLPAQMAYERHWLGTLAGNMASMEYMWGDIARLQKAMADTNPQQRATLNREYLIHNYDNAYAKAQLVPLEKWTNGKVNSQVYKLLVTKKELLEAKRGGRALYGGPGDKVLENFEQLGKQLTTTNLKKADIEMIDGVPHVRLMSKTNAAKLGLEAKHTTNMAMKAYFKTTSMWKAIVLGLAPRFVFNNVVGGSLMHLADNMGSHSVFGMHQAWRHIYGKEKADYLLERAIKENGYLNKKQDWLQNNYGDQLGQGFYYSAGPHRTSTGQLTESAKLRGEVEDRELSAQNVLTKASNPAFKFTSKAERYLRASAIISNVRSHPIVQAEMKRLQKYPHWRDKKNRKKLFDHVAVWAHKEHPEIAKQVAQDVEQTMGNYSLLTSAERKVRAVDPFYLWQRHIVKHGTHMALDRPGRTNLGQQLGVMGGQWAEEELGGEIPDFMEALVPFGDKDPVTGRVLAGGTQGMNPYATVGELATAAAAFLPGEDPQGLKTTGEGLGPLMNPFLASGIEEVTGTSLLTGQPQYTEQGGLQGFFNNLGPIGAVLGSPVARLPQVTAIENSLFPQEYKDPTLYSKSPAEYLSALLGVPFKWVDPKAAQKLARQQNARRGVDE